MPTTTDSLSPETALSNPSFIVTKEYRRFAEFCDACRRERYIGLCYGPPGVGKTLSAHHYAQWDLIQPHLAHPLLASPVPKSSVIAECYTLLYTAPVANTPRLIDKELRRLATAFSWLVEEVRYAPEFPPTKQIPNHCQLLIIDEADRLKTQSLEQLRDIYDQGKIGLIFIGMPGLERRLARYPQLYSRVGFAHPFRAVSEAEMYFLLEHHWSQLGLTLHREDFTDAEAIATIIRITAGNFRLLHRLFTQIQRVLQINHMTTISKEVVEAARECLVIGVV